MKNKQLVQVENEDCYVFTLEEFEEYVNNGSITMYDGYGYFHDGENETDICVWDEELPWEDFGKFQYVCWYNK